MRATHLIGDESVFNKLEMCRVCILNPDSLFAIRCNTNDAITDDAHNPNIARYIQRHAIGESAGTKFGNDFFCAERAICVNGKA
jgi:hypothetical protein